jgi:HlyD family secretion protein
MTQTLRDKSSNRWLIALMVVAGTMVVAATFYGISFIVQRDSKSSSTPLPPVKKALVPNISALGRLEPLAEVIRLSAPMNLDKDRVAKLLVKVGDNTQKGQVVAILDSHERLQLALLEAKEQVRVVRSRLSQVQAGAKIGEIQAQEATIAKLQAELQGEIATQTANISRWQSETNNALSEYKRFQNLYKEGAIAVADLDRKRLVLETAQAQLQQAFAQQNRTTATLQAQIIEAKGELNRITEVRPVDIQVAKIEVDKAIATMNRAQNDLNQAYIRAPITGKILKIHTLPGEKLSDNGIADIAQTNDMVAIAEVYQTDIAKIRIGQQAVITSQAFPGQVRGKVYQIGLEVSRQNVFSTQPGENLDRRVVEVKIRLTPEDSKQVSNLTNLQVLVTIQE